MTKFRLAALALAVMGWAATSASSANEPDNLHDFTMTSIEGRQVNLARFRGRVVLVVNTASRCGLTPQLAGLEALHQRFRTQGFSVLGFPANNFGNQEPGTNEEIAQFCSERFGVTFPLFSKISVRGDDIHPLYRWLVSQTRGQNAVEWNFAKFLVGKDGKVRARFGPQVPPDDPSLVAAIREALRR